MGKAPLKRLIWTARGKHRAGGAGRSACRDARGVREAWRGFGGSTKRQGRSATAGHAGHGQAQRTWPCFATQTSRSAPSMPGCLPHARQSDVEIRRPCMHARRRTPNWIGGVRVSNRIDKTSYRDNYPYRNDRVFVPNWRHEKYHGRARAGSRGGWGRWVPSPSRARRASRLVRRPVRARRRCPIFGQ